MHDQNPGWSWLALLLPAAALLLAGCILAVEEIHDAVFALLKLVVIR